MTPRVALALVLLAFAACNRERSLGPEPELSPDAKAEREALLPNARAVSKEAEGLLRAQDELVWKSWTEGAAADIGQTYRGKDALFTPSSIQKLERLRELTQDPREIRALTYLQNYFVGEYLARSVNDLTDAIANLEASMSFNVDGRDYAYRNLERLLANEKSSVKRHALWTAASSSVERLSQSLRRKNDRLEELVLGLGYPSYEAFGAELRQVDLTQLGMLAERILEVTDAPYHQVLERLVKEELQLPLDKVQRSDISRLLRPTGVDAFFPKSEILPRAVTTLNGMGLSLNKLPNIHLDLRDLPKKNARGLTLPVEVPSNVRISLKLQGGAKDQRELFHELGHALHDGLTQEKRFELAKLGNGTVAEAFAYVFEGLMEDPVWLEQMAGLSGEKLNAYLEASSAHQLFLLRRAAGKLVYQLALHRGPVTDVPALYKGIMERTLGLPMNKDDVARAVVDQEDFYPAADSFRAWFLAGQIQGQLKARFGPMWWKEAKAGAFLKGLWAPGNGKSAEEIARAMGDNGIRPDVLLLRLASTLKVPLILKANPTAPPAPARPALPSAVQTASPPPPSQEVAASDAGVPSPLRPSTLPPDGGSAPSLSPNRGAPIPDAGR